MANHPLSGLRIAILLTATLVALPARAGGPSYLLTEAGEPYRWDNSQPILIGVDQGPLGRFSNEQANAIVDAALAEWQKVETARIQFQKGDPLGRDVTGTNLNTFLNELGNTVTPIIFDNDGRVTDALLGAGASRSAIAVGGIFGASGDGVITQGIVIINARAADGLFDPDDPAEEELTRQVVRAIGQMLGLGSTDANDELTFDGDVANNRAIPVMGITRVVGGSVSPTLDDRMTLSWLYPSDAIDSQTGIIRGKVLLPDGTTPIQGIAVVARNVEDPVNGVVSAFSGATFLNSDRNGSRDPNLRGAFEMRVPPGRYTLQIRPVRGNIGPLELVMPLPGGPKFYQATPSNDPTAATPVTVAAGGTAEVNIVANGPAAPAPQAAQEAEPNDAHFQAMRLPLSATIAGSASPTDPGQVVLDVGGGARDDVEDLYRIDVKEPSLITMQLSPQDPANLDLYLFIGVLGGAAPLQVNSNASGAGAEYLQLPVDPGVFTIGVSARDGAAGGATEYNLSVITTPLPELPLPPIPVLDRLVIGDITGTSAEARWITDRDATADSIVALPRRQLGDPRVGTTHQIALTGLAAGATNGVQNFSQAPGGRIDGFPRVFFRTADASAATGAPKVAASYLGLTTDFIGDGDAEQSTRFVALGLHNSGGNATNVRVTSLAATPGWKLALPLTEPLPVGAIGSGGTAIVVVRLLRDGTGIEPLAAVTGTVTLTGADGATQEVAIGQ
jgi:hypothetical protein